MKNKVFLLAVALLVATLLFSFGTRIGKLEKASTVVEVAATQCIRDPHNHGFNADCESLTMNGHDITMYSGAETGQTIKLEGAQGRITTTGSIDVGGVASFGAGGLAIVGNITMSNGYLYNSKGAITVGDSIDMSGSLFMGDGYIINTKGAVSITDDINMTGDLTMNTGGEIIQSSGGVTITDDLELSGDFSMNAGGRIIQRNGAVTVSDELSVVGGLYAEGSVYVAYDAFIDRWLNIDDHATITVTSWLTPSSASSFSPIAAAAWATPTVASGCVPGDLWVIENWGTENICLADGSNLYLAGSVDWTGGVHDTLMLICDPGGNWIELTRANN